MLHKKFILDSFKLLEDSNHIEFSFQLSDAITFNLNNKEIGVGKKAVKDELTKCYSPLTKYDHTFLNVWEVDNTYTITADLGIKEHNNEQVDISWIAVIKINDNKISKMEIFADFFNIEQKIEA